MFYGPVDGERTDRLTISGRSPHRERITHLAFNAESKLLVCGSEDDLATWWRIEGNDWHSHGKRLTPEVTANILQVAVSRTGEKLALASADGQAVVFQRKGNNNYTPIQKIKQAKKSQGAMLQVGFVEHSNEGRYCFVVGRTVRCACD